MAKHHRVTGSTLGGLRAGVAVLLALGLVALAVPSRNDEVPPRPDGSRRSSSGGQMAQSVPPTDEAVRAQRPALQRPQIKNDAGGALRPTATTPPFSTPGDPHPDLKTAGTNGKCAVSRRSIQNPFDAENAQPGPVWIYEPTGSAEASVAGGRCDGGSRPAILIAHGYGQTDPTSYEALIAHFVSVGNVVVYPAYSLDDGTRATLEESYAVVDAGLTAALKATPRVDTTRIGWWGHSHGGGMVPYLAQQGWRRGWGSRGLWMSLLAPAYTLLVGSAEILAPPKARAMVIGFQDDALADARLGIDDYLSLLLPRSQKHYLVVHTDPASAFVADHGAPSGGNGLGVDDVDALIFRYADLLQFCAVSGAGCDADLTVDRSGTRRATRTEEPVDFGPYPAALAECDSGQGPELNPRIERCGETRISA